MAESSVPKRVRSFDPIIYGVSATLTVLFVLWSALFPESMETVVNAVFNWTTEEWGWLYLWTVFLLVGASIVLFVTKFGAMKLGKPDDKPDFSSLTLGL
jgi:choline/glycine/proline betaine transport protein/glycine betaine transporter